MRTKTLWTLIALLALLTVGALVSLAGCGSGTSGAVETTAVTTGGDATATTAGSETADTDQVFTVEELAQYDGKDGASAYVAVDGVVYDVTDSPSWSDGTHSRCNLGAVAGQDLSELIKQAPPNMRSLLEARPVVGTLAQ
jgi:predicted heme/steroid binding protein